ncbi:MAG: biotin--[acetyl-CoA-carboxylase] ligase [Treponema sp.]|jgi:BirA family biotin operon repressor/biotin-[acetyl-CoA-carboxylase] ligase|nr:biotin--[acetyl-CoA-carboxylase] ligase [Treponema sp.]
MRQEGKNMKIIDIKNPWGANIYHEEVVSSTMDISRNLAARGETHGTVICADFQTAGRGRVRDRTWLMEKGQSLPFTVLLRYPSVQEIPAALTLRAGLAVCRAIAVFSPPLEDRLKIKWPNDIMFKDKKMAGILCEAEGGNAYTGIGINFAQKDFPPGLQKAVSVAFAADTEYSPNERFTLLEKTLFCLKRELESDDWKERLEQSLYKKGERVEFIDGEAGSQKSVTGILAGISDTGELLIIPDCETEERAFISGELRLSWDSHIKHCN